MAEHGGRGRLIVGMAAGLLIQASWILAPSVAPVARAATLAVDDTGDAGDVAPGNGVCATPAGTCTLRAALDEANAFPGRDTVTFAIDGSGVQTISLTTELPTLIDPAGTVIDGYTQPGASPNTDPTVFDATILVEIVGTGPTGIDGFVVNGPNNVIRGLSIYQFRRGIRLFGTDARDNQIVGNLLGTDPSGTFTSPAYVGGSMSVNIQAGANNNRIGMPGNANRNVISGNYHHGVALYDNNTNANRIQNNLIGFTPDGTGPLQNRGHGIDVNTWASETLIGGTGFQERNAIAATGQSGVEISHGPGTVGNQIIGNLIGTTPDGTSAPAWAAVTQFAVNLEGVAVCAEVCEPDMHSAVVAGNVLVNSTGGVMLHKATYGNVISGNRIGMLADGTPAPNTVFDVRIEKGAFDNTIGPGNELGHSPNGIQVVTDGSNPPSPEPVDTSGNTITRNSIHDHGGLGIDVAPLGAVTTLPSALANGGAPVPTVTASTSAGATVAACVGCTVELFRSDGAAGVFGEGIEYLGSAVVPATGSVKIQVPPSVRGSAVTATATLTDGSTSEFSSGRLIPTSSPTNVAPTASYTVSCVVTTCTFSGGASTDADGTIEWYQWDFGNGVTRTTTTPSTTYDYMASGAFTTTLTVIDNSAATATATRQANPFNQTPTAAFTASCDLQLCRFTSSAADADGTIAGRSWNFGGVSTSTDTNPTFVFPGGGTFVVTHTATDNSGSSTTTSQTLTIAPFPNGLVGLDGFTRTGTNGWGTAPMGGVWTYPIGNQQDFSVSGNRGVITASTTAALRSTTLSGVTQQDVTVSATVNTDKAPVSWGLTSYVAARQVAPRTEYRARLRQSSSGAVYLALVKTVNSSNQILIGSEVLVPGLPSGADNNLRVSLSVAGTNPTTLRAKAWVASNPEPTAWNLTTTDGEPALQAIGAVAVGAAPGSAHTDLPVRFRFDDVQVVTDNDPPVPSIDADCVNTQCSFSAAGSTDPDGSIVFYSWNFGDGASTSGSGSSTPVRTYATFGTYDVTLTLTDDKGGSGSITVPVAVTNALPEPRIAYDCDELTCSFSSADSTDPDGTVVGYEWNFADGTTSTLAAPTHTYDETDIYTVTLTAIDDDGGEATTTVTIEPTLAPTAAFDATCTMTTCEFDGTLSSDPDGTVVGYAWSFGDGNIGSGPNPTHTFTGGGPYNVTLTVTDNAGITGTTTAPVDPNAPPTPMIDYACDDYACDFDGTGSLDPDGTVVAYAWDFGDGATATTPTPTNTYASTGSFTVTLTVTDAEGGTASTTTNVGISATPIATFAVTCDLVDCAVDGTGSLDPDGTSITYSWNWGDGTPLGSGQTATHTYADGLPRTIVLSVTDESGSVGSATQAIDPNAAPVPSFSSDCAGLFCTFDAGASTDDDGIQTYAWQFGDGTTATGITAPHSYASKSTYTVTLTVTDLDGVSRSTSRQVVPNAPPVASFTAACPSLACSFDAATSSDPDGSIVTYAWAFGDGATATGTTAQHTYAMPGTYTVTLTVTDDDGATDSTTLDVSTNDLPAASFTVTCTVNTCLVDAAGSTDPDGSLVGYTWSWGDGTTSNGISTSHTYDTVLPTSIELTVTDDDGGADTTTRPIALSRVVATDTFTRSVQNGWGAADQGGSWTVFGGTGAGTAFSVSGGTARIDLPTAGSGRSARMLAVFGRDVDVATTFRTASAPTGLGQYVAIIGRRSGTNLEYRARVRIAADGQFFLGAVKLTGTSTETLIGSEVVVPGVTHAPGADYRVRAQFDGADPTTIRIRLWPAGSTEPATWTLVRTDSQIQMQSGGSVGVNVALSGSATIAPVLFTLDDVAARFISDPPAGTISATCDGVVCTFSSAAVVDPDGSVVDHTWDFGDGSTGTGPNPTHTYATGGTKNVTLTAIDNEGAVGAISGTASPVGANVPPVAAFTVTCQARTCTFDGAASNDPNGTVQSYAWAFGDGTTASGATVTRTYSVPGSYTVTLTVTDDQGDSDSETATATVSNLIAADTFTRTVTSGIGSADPGGAWTPTGGTGTTSFGVDGQVATLDTATAGSARSMRLLAVDQRDVDLRVRFRADDAPTGFGQYVSIVGRNRGTNLEYRARVRVAPAGVFVAAVKNVSSPTETLIGAEVQVAGITPAANQWYRARAQFHGSSPTTIRIKLWLDGQPEPEAWTIVRTDSQSQLQASGAIGVYTGLSGSATNAPTRFSVDDVVARVVGAAPTAAFTVDCAGLVCAFDATGSSDPDGAIDSYTWTFGDGTTATGATPTHSYATGGAKAVTLRVTDGDGDIDDVAGVASPIGANQLPTAVFTSTCSGLTCTFDGGTSTDPDGAITAWSWDLGDGATATGASTVHTFAAAGSYTVTLTVTDDRGGTDPVTGSVTVTTTVQADAFGRAVTNGWGTADQGGAWVRTSGAASGFAVDGSRGTMTVAAGAGLGQRLGSGLASSDVTVTVSADKPATGFGIMASVVGRSVSATNEYRVRARIAPNGQVFLALVRLAGSSSEQLIGAETAVPGLLVATGEAVTVRFRVQGTSPTTLAARAWRASSPEPTTWLLTATDATAALQASGRTGLHAVLSSSATNGPVVLRFDDLRITL